jgi:hypothetical protein
MNLARGLGGSSPQRHQRPGHRSRRVSLKAHLPSDAGRPRAFDWECGQVDMRITRQAGREMSVSHKCARDADQDMGRADLGFLRAAVRRGQRARRRCEAPMSACELSVRALRDDPPDRVQDLEDLMRRLIITFAAAASVTLAGASSGLFLATPAQADGGPVGSCPGPFALVSASIQPSTDFNGDGLVCERLLTPTDQPFGPGFAIVIDNTVQG